MNTEIIRVKIVKNTESQSSGEIKQRAWEKKERLYRAFKALGICWAIALGCVLIPILHFVLVPVFFLLGPFFFFGMYSETISQQGGKGICPECKKEFDIVAGKELPFDDMCNHCRAHFKISQA